MFTPPGQENYFLEVADPLPDRSAPPPVLTPAQRAERVQRAKALAAKYRTEFLV
jgi:hypothetical protein